MLEALVSDIVQVPAGPRLQLFSEGYSGWCDEFRGSICPVAQTRQGLWSEQASSYAGVTSR